MRTVALASILLSTAVAFAGSPSGKSKSKAKAKGKTSAKMTPAPSHKAKDGPPELVFTFDDGPGLATTPKVLDTLDKHHVHAVFFVLGEHFAGTSSSAKKAQDLLREELRRGHIVGNHTVHHDFLCGKRGPHIAEDEITKNAAYIKAATGVAPPLYRTPYGSHCASLAAILAKVGVKHTGWDIDPEDWKVKNTNIVRDRVIAGIKAAHGRTIVLMHDIHEDTVEALPQILDWIDQENAARARKGLPQIKILDGTALLHAAPKPTATTPPPAPPRAG